MDILSKDRKGKKNKDEGYGRSYRRGDTFSGGHGRLYGNYEVRLKDENDEFYILELKARRKKVKYRTVMMDVSKKYMLPIHIKLYRKGFKKPSIVMVQKDIEVIDGIPTARTIEIDNREKRTKTVVEVRYVDYKTVPDDSIFILKKGTKDEK